MLLLQRYVNLSELAILSIHILNTMGVLVKGIWEGQNICFGQIYIYPNNPNTIYDNRCITTFLVFAHVFILQFSFCVDGDKSMNFRNLGRNRRCGYCFCLKCQGEAKMFCRKKHILLGQSGWKCGSRSFCPFLFVLLVVAH